MEWKVSYFQKISNIFKKIQNKNVKKNEQKTFFLSKMLFLTTFSLTQERDNNFIFQKRRTKIFCKICFFICQNFAHHNKISWPERIMKYELKTWGRQKKRIQYRRPLLFAGVTFQKLPANTKTSDNKGRFTSIKIVILPAKSGRILHFFAKVRG